MGLFNKKNKNKNKTSKAEFKIVIWEDVGYSVREVLTFEANRFVDEDKTPFIFNEELKFMELYPQDIKDMDLLNEKQIDIRLKKKQDQLKEIRSKEVEDYNEDEPNTKDLEHEIMSLEAKKRGLKFSKSAAYVSFDIHGQVTFNFLRRGTTFFPLKWDTDTKTIFTASEPVVKKAGILLRNKENKYLPKQLIETATLILLALVIVGGLANLFFGGWLWKKYDESGLAELERKQLELQNLCSEFVLSNANILMDIQKQITMEINGSTTTNIQGLIPS